MKNITFLPYTTDVKIKVEADTISDLFVAALDGMNKILHDEDLHSPHETLATIEIQSEDYTTLLIEFLSEILTLSYLNKKIFSIDKILSIDTDRILVRIAGRDIESFSEDIKEVTYHNARITKNTDGNWESTIIFET